MIEMRGKSNPGLRILLVEDDPGMAQVITVISQMAGARAIYTARNGEEAARLAREHRPDLVITDAVVPRSDGIQVLDRIAEEVGGRPTPSILVARGDQRPAVEGRLAGRTEVSIVTKPFKPELLLGLLQRAGGGLASGLDAAIPA